MPLGKSILAALSLSGLLALSACMTASSRNSTEGDEPFAILTAYFDN